MTTIQDAPAASSNGRVGELLHRISDDMKTIARDEVELVRTEVERTTRAAATDAAVVLLGGIVALIGLGLLCLVAVVALAPVIPPLWLRLLLMSIVYLVVGGGVAAGFARRLGHERPDLALPSREARETMDAIRSGLRGEGKDASHA